MKPTFHHRLVNNPYEDPCLFVRMLRERRAFLFDAGNMERLSQGDLLKVTDLFVTHMHIDHFIGFDTLLRSVLRREVPLRVYGPEPIVDSVEGKLRGYTWNLIKEYPVKIEVYAVGCGKVRHVSFHAKNSFRRVERKERSFDGTLLEEPPYKVLAANLSHGVPSLGFTLEEDFHINIDKARLTAMGLPVGPWLSDLKRNIRSGAEPNTPMRISGRELTLGELSRIVAITEGQKISYVTDVSPEEENISRIVELVRGSDTLYCEAYFLHEEIERAIERSHLTAKLAGRIAREAGVRSLVLMHISPRYRDQMDKLEEEAMREFRR